MEKQPAKINYFFGQGYKDLGNTIRDSWENNKISAKENFNKASNYYWRSWYAFVKFFLYAAGITMYVFGTVWFLALSLLHIVILFIFFFIVYFLFTFTWILDYLYRVKEKIFAPCPNPDCHKKSNLPIYHCPKCGVAHTRLWPSKYGIWNRTCECGKKIPCTFFNGRGKLRATCPHCHNEINTEEGTPLIVPIVGAPYAGKSTYLYSMLDSLMSEFKNRGYKIESKINQRLIDDSIRSLSSGELRKTVDNDTKAVDLIISKGSIKYAIYFYDVAGEAFNASKNIEGHKFYGYFSAMIFVLDPFAVEQIRTEYYNQFKKHLNNLSNANANTYDNTLGLNEVLATLTRNLAENYDIKDKEKVNQSLAVIIPKTDLFTDKILSTDKECRSFLTKFGQKSFVDQLEWKFKNMRFFNVVSKGKNSKGVLQPFDWILKRDMQQKWFRRFFGNLLMAFFIIVVVGGLLLGGFFAYKGISTYFANRAYNYGSVETPAAQQPNYFCNTASLNVRSVANKDAGIVGKLTKGEEIYVYSIDSATNFARIDFHGRVAYVSADFLSPKNITTVAANNTNTKPAQVAEAAGLTGWSTFQLQGQVEKTIYDDGRYIYFNTDGNVLKHNVRESANGQKEFEYVYSSSTRFAVKGDKSNTPYKIVIGKNTRQEIWDDSEGLGLTFNYDAKGNLTEVKEPNYGYGRSETYTYEATNTYPSKEEVEYYSDDGSGTKESFVFSNYTFDSQGNWISRSVNYKEVVQDEDGKSKTTTKDYSEKRVISYFN